jgi:hypothetical protein
MTLATHDERMTPSVKIWSPPPDEFGEDPCDALPRSTYMIGWGVPVANDPLHHEQLFGGSCEAL